MCCVLTSVREYVQEGKRGGLDKTEAKRWSEQIKVEKEQQREGKTESKRKG